MINFYEVKNLFCKNNSFSTIFDELTKVNKKPSDFSEGFFVFILYLFTSIKIFRHKEILQKHFLVFLIQLSFYKNLDCKI